MYIFENYKKDLEHLPELTNEEFMAQQIWALQHTFKDELAAIKNNKCEFIAFTESTSQRI